MNQIIAWILVAGAAAVAVLAFAQWPRKAELAAFPDLAAPERRRARALAIGAGALLVAAVLAGVWSI